MAADSKGRLSLLEQQAATTEQRLSLVEQQSASRDGRFDTMETTTETRFETLEMNVQELNDRARRFRRCLLGKAVLALALAAAASSGEVRAAGCPLALKLVSVASALDITGKMGVESLVACEVGTDDPVTLEQLGRRLANAAETVGKKAIESLVPGEANTKMLEQLRRFSASKADAAEIAGKRGIGLPVDGEANASDATAPELLEHRPADDADAADTCCRTGVDEQIVGKERVSSTYSKEQVYDTAAAETSVNDTSTLEHVDVRMTEEASVRRLARELEELGCPIFIVEVFYRSEVFVNQVAEIVYRIMDEHLGAANKNVGEALAKIFSDHFGHGFLCLAILAAVAMIRADLLWDEYAPFPKDNCVKLGARVFTVLPQASPHTEWNGLGGDRPNGPFVVPTGWEVVDASEGDFKGVARDVIGRNHWHADAIVARAGKSWPTWGTAKAGPWRGKRCTDNWSEFRSGRETFEFTDRYSGVRLLIERA